MNEDEKKQKYARIFIEYQIDQMDGLEISKILGIYHICFSSTYVYSYTVHAWYQGTIYFYSNLVVGIAIYLPHNLSLIHPEENESMHFVIIKTKSKLVLLHFFLYRRMIFFGGFRIYSKLNLHFKF